MGKPRARLIHDLSFGLPAAFHDVADFPHSADIGIADALPIRTAITICEEATATGLQKHPLIGRRAAHCPSKLRRHIAIQRG